MTDTNWHLSSEELPTQGTKILCFDKGDVWVAQRFQECWFPIPFCDSKLASYKAPQRWAYIEFPEGYYGKLRVQCLPNKRLMDMDEMEQCNPEGFQKIKNMMKAEMDARDKQ